eukprot:TRINITY_DN7458_c0_g1_i1.p1 TRINITY_DN7458_c0_g1~~TRINITY_DN7458_c0_g1_i1.p1  ORF type:complete len:637 (+),score=167.55 TRINITY_DN7458_c0_g1_i1:84-1994(+)
MTQKKTTDQSKTGDLAKKDKGKEREKEKELEREKEREKEKEKERDERKKRKDKQDTEKKNQEKNNKELEKKNTDEKTSDSNAKRIPSAEKKTNGLEKNDTDEEEINIIMDDELNMDGEENMDLDTETLLDVKEEIEPENEVDFTTSYQCQFKGDDEAIQEQLQFRDKTTFVGDNYFQSVEPRPTEKSIPVPLQISNEKLNFGSFMSEPDTSLMESKEEVSDESPFNDAESEEEFEEPTEEILKIEVFPDDEGVLSSIIEYMYTGTIDINVKNCALLMSIARKYIIFTLQREVRDFFRKNLQRETALELLYAAIAHEPSMIAPCIDKVARNFCFLYNASYNDLDPEYFLEIIRNEKLAVRQEYSLFLTVCDYFSHHPELTKQQKYDIMACVRFSLCSYQELIEIAQNKLVPCPLILEVLMLRLAQHEQPNSPGSNAPLPESPYPKRELGFNPLRFQPRPKLSVVFEFTPQSTQFFKGIIGWIATNCQKSEWKNPHTTGRVKVHCSSLAKGSRFTLVDIQHAEVWTNDIASSWLSIDFGPHRRITPSYYSLRHGGNYKADALRTWDLQGSVDGIVWTTINRHANDDSLNGAFAVSHFPVLGSTESFRFFRILQTGHNSSNHNFLLLSGFEFYGTLYDN